MHIRHTYFVIICLVASSVKIIQPGPFKLITCLYNETKNERINEYLRCLDKNLANQAIDHIHVIYDTSKDNDNQIFLTMLKYRQISISYQNRPQTFGDCFDVANKLFPNSSVIVCNADIYFNETLSLIENVDLSTRFLALTRWNVTQNGKLEMFWMNQVLRAERSQDAWIFSTPIRKFLSDDIRLGLPGCDAAIAHEARAVGLDVVNPCQTIQACHLHLSGQRNYIPTKRIYPSYPGERVTWITLENMLSQKKEL